MALMNRRRLLGGAAALALVAAGTGWYYRWVARRLLIRAGLRRPPSNLLRNAGFLVCTNGAVPDYWGTNAAAELGDMTDRLTVVDGSAVDGTRALRVSNPRSDYDLTVFGCITFVPKPVPYTFSVYVRSESGPQPVALQLGWDRRHETTAGAAWQRVSCTYTPEVEASFPYGLETRIIVMGAGALRVCAPQLEVGQAPTPFDLALMDDHPLPSIPWQDDWSRAAGGRRPWPLDGHEKTQVGMGLITPTTGAWRDIAASGSAAVVVFLREHEAGATWLQESRRILDEAQAAGLRVVAATASPRNGTVAERTAAVVAAVNALKEHPAIDAWMYLDEPSQAWARPPWVEIGGMYRAVREADPTRPAMLNDNRWAADAGTAHDGPLAASDIGCVLCYPVGQWANSVQAVAEVSARLNRDCEDHGKPSAMWLPIYGWHDAVREPTIDELRAMVTTTWIHGTRLVFLFVYRPSSERLWRYMPALRDEIGRYEKAIGAPDAKPVRWGTAGRRLHYSCWQARGRHYVFVCNIAPESVWTVLDPGAIGVPGFAGLVAWFAGTREFRAGRRLLVVFPPYARQVYEIGDC